jgi:hypothetical protein
MTDRHMNFPIVSAAILLVATGAQAESISRISPSTSSVTTYDEHTVTFKVKTGTVTTGTWDNWEEIRWYVDGWLVATTPEAFDNTIVSWSRTFTEQRDYQVKARGKWIHRGFFSDEYRYTDYIYWTVSVLNCDPVVARVSPGSGVTAYEGIAQTFAYRATDPGGDLARAVWSVNGEEDLTDTLSGGSAERGRYTSFPTAGTYDLGVRVYDVHDFSDYTSWTVTVLSHDPSVSIVSPSSPVSFHKGDTITFTAQATDPAGDLSGVGWYVNAELTHTETLHGSSATITFTHTFDEGRHYEHVWAYVYHYADSDNPGIAEWALQEIPTEILKVSSGPGGTVTAPGEGTFEYDRGATVVLTATPQAGYTFTNWSGNFWSTSNPLTLTLTNSYDVQANFTTGAGDDIPAEAPVNLMPNPSFEIHTDDSYDPDGWALWGSSLNPGGGDSSQEWWQVCDLARTGCWSCRLRAGSSDYALAVAPLVETIPGQTYYVGAWVKDLQPAYRRSGAPARPKQPAQRRSASAARFKFEYLDSDTQDNRDDSQTYAVDLPIPLDDEWHWVHVKLNPSTTHPWVKVLLLVENWSGDDSVSDYLYDDIWFGAELPYHGNRYVAIAAGDYHSLALKYDGSIVGWGNDDFGQARPPGGDDFIALAAGAAGSHSLALRSDGSIVGWGDDQYGQATPPAGNDFVALAAGSRHSLALRADGSIVAWGDNSNGQSDPPPGNDFIAIAAGILHSVALKSDGGIVAWGRDTFGQSSPPAGNDFVAIAGGGMFSLALKTDGRVVGWGGKNGFGQINPPAGNDFVALSAGRNHGLALKTDGSIVGWGNDDLGKATPPEDSGFAAIAAGGWHSLALKPDGTIIGWGDDEQGQATAP